LEDSYSSLSLFFIANLWVNPALIAGLISIAVLLMLSALVAVMEVAYFSLTPAHLNELRNSEHKSASMVIQLLDKSKYLIATIVLCHNLVNIGVVIITETLSAELFQFEDELTAFLVKVVVVTFVILFFGEVVPKIYTNRNPLGLALRFAGLMDFLLRFFRPVSNLLIKSTAIIDRSVKRESATLSVEELSQALELTSNESTPEEERKILEGIIEFGNTEVKEIMCSRLDVVALNDQMSLTDVVNIINQHGFSRLPVYKETLDQISGILVVKDLLPYVENMDNFKWQILIRPAFVVPENKKIDDLLREFQRRKIHLAVVVDEYGGTSGIVTLDDIIEEIMGDISDEFDDEQLFYSKLDEHNYVFEGKIPLNDLYRVLDIDGEEFEKNRGDADTLAGFILELSGRFPKRNEVISFRNFRFTIEAADKRRITRIKLSIQDEQTPKDSGSSSMNAGVAIVLIALGSLLSSCTDDYTPRPRGYFRIDLPEHAYRSFDSACAFSFDYSKHAVIEPYSGKSDGPCWMNISYPRYKAKIHLSYVEVKGNLDKELNDARELVYKHTVRADGIEEFPVMDAESKVYGIYYTIDGNTASARQFFLTDSSRHFVRAALYFSASPNSDSLSPVLKFIDEDIDRMINSFKWK
jgi:putative hemolysin